MSDIARSLSDDSEEDAPDGGNIDDSSQINGDDENLPDIDEDVEPGTRPIVRFEKANNRLRRWIVAGLGILLAWVLGLAPLMVLVRPELVDFATSYTQVSIGGLLGIAGSVVGFLFAREQDPELRQVTRRRRRGATAM